MSKTIDLPLKKTPWGFNAIPADSPSCKYSLNQGCTHNNYRKNLGYIFKGPLNTNATCWLDAVLALGLSLSWEFFRKCLRIRENTPAEQYHNMRDSH